MTTLYLLVGIIWVSYGVFSWKQDGCNEDENNGPLLITEVAFAPIILLLKAIYGIFKEY